MKVRRIQVAAVALLLVTGLLGWLMSRQPAPRPAAVPPRSMLPTSPSATAAERFTEDLSAEFLKGYGLAGSTPEKDLEQVKDVVDAFVRSVKIPGALPTGSNRELVAALAGENAHRIRFIDPTVSYLNADGELVDRWQVPVFFHFVEADDVGVRSAGPDRMMWTADDVLMGEHALSE
ncbi:MAG: hypothetical protein WEB53_16570 [Akkermansiaceae bacterium]